MSEQSLLDRMKEENRTSHRLDRITLLTHPLFFIFCWWMSNRYIVYVPFSKENITFLVVVFAFIEIVIIARRLNRDRVYIESLIIGEVEPMVSRTGGFSIPSWKSFKVKFRVVEAIPTALLILIPIAALVFPLSLFRFYLKEMFLLVLIADICITGLLRLIRFRNYMNALISLYQSIIQTNRNKLITPDFMSYDFRSVLIYAALSSLVFFVICRYWLLAKTNIVYVLLLAMGIGVLFILGKGLHAAIKGFHKSITEIDILRRELVMCEKGK